MQELTKHSTCDNAICKTLYLNRLRINLRGKSGKLYEMHYDTGLSRINTTKDIHHYFRQGCSMVIWSQG